MTNPDPMDRHSIPLKDWTPEMIEEEFFRWLSVTEVYHNPGMAASQAWRAALELAGALPIQEPEVMELVGCEILTPVAQDHIVEQKRVAETETEEAKSQ